MSCTQILKKLLLNLFCLAVKGDYMAKKIKSFDDYKSIKATKTEYSKVGSRWVMIKKQKMLVSPKEHKRATDEKTLKFFRGMGGYEKNDYGYTFAGYLPTQNISISPDRKTKIVRNYNFAGSRKLHDYKLDLYRNQFNKKKNK